MKKRCVSLLFCAALVVGLSAPVRAISQGFSDLSGHWARQDIEEAAEAGWAGGYPDGTFRPDGTVTRAEFVKMLMAATHLTPDSGTAAFLVGRRSPAMDTALTDMRGHWLTAQGWTLPALCFGLIVPDDYSDHAFGPDTPITRYEIAVMADRVLGLVYPAGQPVAEEPAFSDENRMPEWVRGYAREAVEAGVLACGPDGSFGGSSTVTRAEAVIMTSRALQFMETGVDRDIRVFVRKQMNNGEYGQISADSPPAQVIDGRVYVSARSIFSAWSKLCGNSDDPAAAWEPVRQQLSIQFVLQSTFGAGDGRYEGQGFWQGINEYSPRLPAAARLLYGEIMIPVYDPDGKHASNLWPNGDWDPAGKTLVLHVDDPFVPSS